MNFRRLKKSISAVLLLSFFSSHPLYAFYGAPSVCPCAAAPFQIPSYTEDTNIIGLAISTIQGNIITNPGTTLETAFSNIRPDLVTSLERYGVEKLSSSIGLPPIVGQTLGSAVSNTLNVAWADGANVGQNIISSVNQGLTHGIVSYGINFVGNSNPILGSLLSPDIQNSIEQSIGQQGLFPGIFNIIGRTTQGLLQGVSTIGQGVQSFGSLIQQKGLVGALGQTLGSFFGRSSVEQILNQGGVATSLSNAPRRQVTLSNGQTFEEAQLTPSAGIYFDSQGALLGVRDEGLIQIGSFGLDSNGEIFLEDGQIYSDLPNQNNLSIEVENYNPIHIEVRDSQNQSLLDIRPREGEQSIRIEAPSQDQPIPSFLSAIISIMRGWSFSFFEGVAEAATLTPQVSAQTAGRLTDVVLMGGFSLLRRDAPDAIVDYFRIGSPFSNQLSLLGIGANSITQIPLFNGFIDLNNFAFPKDEVKRTIDYMRAIRDAQPGRDFVPVAYSGAGHVLLGALSADRPEAMDGFGIKTAVLVGAPIPRPAVHNGPLERIINIYGSEDMFLNPIPPSPPIVHRFTHDQHSLETINIELMGVKHNDQDSYFYSDESTATPLQKKASNFIARLTQAALTQERLTRFLNDLQQFTGTPPRSAFTDPNTGINHDSYTYVVDLGVLPDDF